MARRRTNPDFLNGVPELLILKLLSQQPMYGYQLVQAIKQRTAGQLEFGEGCVYPLLHRLEAEGALHSRRELVAGRERVVYRVTRDGRARLQVTSQRWSNVVGAVRLVVEGGAHGRVQMA